MTTWKKEVECEMAEHGESWTDTAVNGVSLFQGSLINLPPNM